MNLAAIKIEEKISLICTCISTECSVFLTRAKLNCMPKGKKMSESTIDCKQGIVRVHAN